MLPPHMMTNRRILPEVGDIWYNHRGDFHYLIMQDDYAMGYTMLILETGVLDHAFVDHFVTQCIFIS